MNKQGRNVDWSALAIVSPSIMNRRTLSNLTIYRILYNASMRTACLLYSLFPVSCPGSSMFTNAEVNCDSDDVLYLLLHRTSSYYSLLVQVTQQQKYNSRYSRLQQTNQNNQVLSKSHRDRKMAVDDFCNCYMYIVATRPALGPHRFSVEESRWI